MIERTFQRLIACCLASTICLCQPALAERSLFDAALESITAGELYTHVDVLADDTLEGRAAGSRGGRAAARYIETRLQEMGVTPAGDNGRYAQTFYGSYRNLLAVVAGDAEGKDVQEEFIVVGAHYDHVGYGTSETSYGPIGYIHNGADDNASGVSVLLETIEAFQELQEPLRRSILFAFWDGEEQGLLGSKNWVMQPTVPLSQVRLAVNLDMVGRMRDGRLEIGGTRSGYGLRRLLASRSLPERTWLYFDWELKENSDHWPFFNRGVPVVLLHTGLHDDYHRPSDDVQRVNREGMRDTAVYLFDVLYRLANADALPRFRGAAHTETPHTQRRRERPLPPLPPRLGIAFRNANDAEGVTAGMADDSEGKLQTGTNAAPAQAGGIVVTKVNPGSPAEEAGLQVGDRITRVNGIEAANEEAFLQLIQSLPSKVRLTAFREGEPEPVHVAVNLDGEPVRLGISWRADEAEPTAIYLTRIVPGSPAAVAGLRVHDRVYQIHGQSFRGSSDFEARLRAQLEDGDLLKLTIERQGRVMDVNVPPQR